MKTSSNKAIICKTQCLVVRSENVKKKSLHTTPETHTFTFVIQQPQNKNRNTANRRSIQCQLHAWSHNYAPSCIHAMSFIWKPQILAAAVAIWDASLNSYALCPTYYDTFGTDCVRLLRSASSANWCTYEIKETVRKIWDKFSRSKPCCKSPHPLLAIFLWIEPSISSRTTIVTDVIWLSYISFHCKNAQ